MWQLVGEPSERADDLEVLAMRIHALAADADRAVANAQKVKCVCQADKDETVIDTCKTVNGQGDAVEGKNPQAVKSKDCNAEAADINGCGTREDQTNGETTHNDDGSVTTVENESNEGDNKICFGKHKGLTFQEVSAVDVSYVKWSLQNKAKFTSYNGQLWLSWLEKRFKLVKATTVQAR